MVQIPKNGVKRQSRRSLETLILEGFFYIPSVRFDENPGYLESRPESWARDRTDEKGRLRWSTRINRTSARSRPKRCRFRKLIDKKEDLSGCRVKNQGRPGEGIHGESNRLYGISARRREDRNLERRQSHCLGGGQRRTLAPASARRSKMDGDFSRTFRIRRIVLPRI